MACARRKDEGVMETLTVVLEMTVEEWQHATREEIESLEAELRLKDLQDKLQALKLEKERYRARRQSTQAGDHTFPTTGLLDQWSLPIPEMTEEEGVSCYGRSRRTSRDMG